MKNVDAHICVGCGLLARTSVDLCDRQPSDVMRGGSLERFKINSCNGLAFFLCLIVGHPIQILIEHVMPNNRRGGNEGRDKHVAIAL